MYLLFYAPLKNFSLLWRCHHCQWRAAKFRSMLGAQGLWAGRDLYLAIPAVTWDLNFSVSSEQSPITTHKGMWRIYSNPDPHGSLFSRLIWYPWGYWGPVLWDMAQYLMHRIYTILMSTMLYVLLSVSGNDPFPLDLWCYSVPGDGPVISVADLERGMGCSYRYRKGGGGKGPIPYLTQIYKNKNKKTKTFK
jgi:hypothetical protein